MSATQDKSQKITFVYSNLYEIYRKGKKAASESGTVLKAGDLREPTLAVPRVKNYEPTEFLAKRLPAVAKPQAQPQVQAQAQPLALPRAVARPASLRASLPAAPKNEALESLKENLKSLNDLHSRLRFMLQELEELVKD